MPPTDGSGRLFPDIDANIGGAGVLNHPLSVGKIIFEQFGVNLGRIETIALPSIPQAFLEHRNGWAYEDGKIEAAGKLRPRRLVQQQIVAFGKDEACFWRDGASGGNGYFAGAVKTGTRTSCPP